MRPNNSSDPHQSQKMTERARPKVTVILASRALAIIGDSLAGVRPKQVHHKRRPRPILQGPRDPRNLTQALQVLRNSTVNAKMRVVQEACDGHVLKHVAEGEEHGLATVHIHCLLLEPVLFADIAELVVPAQQREIVRPRHHQREKQADHLERKVAPVHVIAEKQELIVAIVERAQQPHQIVERPVKVADDVNGLVLVEQHRSLEEYLLGRLAQVEDAALFELGDRLQMPNAHDVI